jgi:tetratricopeptide (TPR) repeat protein
VPAELGEARLPPQERLRKMAMFARQLLPDEARNLVFSIAPGHIANRQAYLSLLSALLPRGRAEPWMRRVRFVFRDEPVADEPRHPLLAVCGEKIAVTDLDFGPAAIEGALDEEVGDESLPIEARMHALLSLAMMDGAHARTREALERLTHLLGYFQSTKNLPMQALVMNAIGDAYVRTAMIDQGQDWYERALVPASEANHPILLATVIKNLGTVAYTKGRYGDAEQLFDALDKVSGKLLDAETKSWALEWRGLSLEKAGRGDAAVHCWNDGAKLARSTDQPHALRAHLEHLRAFYAQQGLQDRAHVIAEELRRLPAPNQPHA